jgi:hypothetical protein
MESARLILLAAFLWKGMVYFHFENGVPLSVRAIRLNLSFSEYIYIYL